jgi:hypothetical protein
LDRAILFLDLRGDHDLPLHPRLRAVQAPWLMRIALGIFGLLGMLAALFECWLLYHYLRRWLGRRSVWRK